MVWNIHTKYKIVVASGERGEWDKKGKWRECQLYLSGFISFKLKNKS